jgi:hypothetical protein
LDKLLEDKYHPIHTLICEEAANQLKIYMLKRIGDLNRELDERVLAYMALDSIEA